MSIRAVALAAGFAVAIGATIVFSSFAASSTAAAAGAGNFAIERSIPNYVLRWENPLLPPTPVAPIFSH